MEGMKEIRIQGPIAIRMKMKHQVVDVVGIEIRQVNQVHQESAEVGQILDTENVLNQAVIAHH